MTNHPATLAAALAELDPRLGVVAEADRTVYALRPADGASPLVLVAEHANGMVEVSIGDQTVDDERPSWLIPYDDVAGTVELVSSILRPADTGTNPRISRELRDDMVADVFDAEDLDELIAEDLGGFYKCTRCGLPARAPDDEPPAVVELCSACKSSHEPPIELDVELADPSRLWIMPAETLDDVVGRIAYKPGWSFSVSHVVPELVGTDLCPPGRPTAALRVEITGTLDPDGSGERYTFASIQPFDPASIGDPLGWLRSTIRSIELDIGDAWLRLDGELVKGNGS